MHELTRYLTQALTHTMFSVASGPPGPPEAYQRMYGDIYWGSPNARSVTSSLPSLPDDCLEIVSECLRGLLYNFVDAKDRIGHAFPVARDEKNAITLTPNHVLQYRGVSSMSGFARGLLCAAALLGPERASALVHQWATGQPLQGTACLVLDCPSVQGELESVHGLSVRDLPLSSDLLPSSMPVMDSNAIANLLGRPLLQLSVNVTPAFFVPSLADDTYPSFETTTCLGEVSLETFLVALSLVCNRRVRILRGWTDNGQAIAFSDLLPNGLSGSTANGSLGQRRVHSLENNVTTVSDVPPQIPILNPARLRRARELSTKLHRRMNAEPRLGIAVDRWNRSASPGTALSDRLIDLRIALEALYINSDSSELRFRLAATVARHLGDELAERKRISKSVSDFYNAASRVIHGTAFRGHSAC